MKLTPLRKIKSNSKVAETIYDLEGRILLNNGALLTEKLIDKLDLLNINSIYVLEDINEAPIQVKEVIKNELREKSLDLIKNTFYSLNNSYKEYYYFKKIYYLTKNILDEIFENDYLFDFIVDIKKERSNLFNHSLNVAVISLIIGICLDYKRSDLINLCIGGLLHDIGKSLIDIDIINKETPLTYEEFEIVKSHCEKGYYYLLNKDYIHTDVKLIILQHHERIDGLGYPKGLIGSQINKMAKIVSVADVYDTLTSDNNYINSMYASEALEYIMGHANSIFDFDIVNIFSKIIVPYPNGSQVKLSNGDIAIVKETFKDFPFRPNIQIIKSKNKEIEGNVISLIKELSIVIDYIENKSI